MSQPPPMPGLCPNCGYINPAAVATCLRCGFALVAAGRESDNAAPPSLQPPVPPGAPPPPPYGMAPFAPPAWPGAYPAKSKATALLLEILIGVFTTILGIGWFYAGETNTGVTWLVAGLVWNVFAFVLDICTLGIFTFVHIPVNIVLLVISAVNLNSYINQRPYLFRP
jgi:hypothetical protein